MNYFQLFDIPVQFKVDKAQLRRKLFDLSKQGHPDYFINESSADQQAALEKYAAVNVAFKTLSNTDATIKYVLQEKGLLAEEEKYNLPSSFLMEMMDLNEELADAQTSGSEEEKESIRKQIEAMEAQIYSPVKESIEAYNDGEASEQSLLEIKEYYFKKKYLQRLAVLLA